jgi:hypothetical protein
VLLAERTGKGGGGAFTVAFSGRAFEELDWSLGFTTTNATEVSPLTSSVSNSNWNSVSIFNANEEVAANSAYLVKDRFTGSLNWKHNFFGDYATRFGVFYEGRKGKPYSWIYNNDLNGDGTVNDLMYIPTAPGSGEVVFKGPTGVSAAQAEAFFWSVVEAQGLSNFAGGAVDRNSSFAPWTNTFDVRISQELPGFFKGNKATLIFDILNFGNLLNKDWGRIDEIAFRRWSVTQLRRLHGSGCQRPLRLRRQRNRRGFRHPPELRRVAVGGASHPEVRILIEPHPEKPAARPVFFA